MRREYRALKSQSTDEATDALLSAVFNDDTSKLIDFEEYDFSKPPMSYKGKDGKWVQGNTRAARNNMLINLIQQRLMDPETMKQRTTPGGFANASKSAKVMRELLYGSMDGFKQLFGRGKGSNTSSTPWSRYAGNSYEVSSAGDRRFSALNATFNKGTVIDGTDVGGRTVEDVYQSVIKKSGKGQAPSRTSRLNLNPTNVSEEKREIRKKEVIDAYGNPIRYKTSDGIITVIFENGELEVIPFAGNIKDSKGRFLGNKDINYFVGSLKVVEDLAGGKEDFSYTEGYLPLWQEWARQNPRLMEELREKSKGKTLTDKFASTRVSQARALSDILSKSGTPSNSSLDNQPSTSSIMDYVINRVESEDFEDPEPNYDPSDPMTIITYNQQNQVAGKLIGIFANQNTNHAFASLMKSFKISKPIEFAGHSYGDGKVSDFLKHPSGVDVDLNVAEFLAASVDAVKDPVLNFMNLNTVTADAGAILARIGYTTTEIGMLFNQPIIKEVCEYKFNNNVGIDTAIREVRNKYKDQGAIRDKNAPVNPANFTTDKLARNILNDRVARERGDNAMDNNSVALAQLEILDLFNDISAVATDVSRFVTSTKFTASNAVGSTFGDLYAQQMKVANYLDTLGTDASHVEMEVTDRLNAPIMDDDSLTSMSNQDYLDTMIDNPFAYEQAMFDANRKALNVLSKYFPYNKDCYVSARNTMNGLVNYGTLDADTINSIHSDMMVYLLSSQENSEFNGSLPKQTQHGLMSTREYYTQHFAKDLLGFLEINPQLKSMPIFEYMIPEIKETIDPMTGQSTDEISINIQGIGGLAPYMKDEIRESWADLARDPKTSQIATDLFLYNFYKLGFNFSPKAFMNLAPTEVKENIQVPTSESSRSYVDFMRDIMDDKFHIDSESFARQYMLNHLDNNRFGLDARSKTVLDIVKPLAIQNGVAKNEITIDLSDPKIGNENSKYFILRESKKTKSRQFTPMIKINTGQGQVVYMADSFDMTQTSVMTYHKVDKLGTKGQSLQYLGESNSIGVADTNTAESFEYGSTQVEEAEREPSKDGYNREAAINEIAEAMSAAYAKAGIKDEQGENYSVTALRDALNNYEDADIKQTVEDVRQACRVDGVIVLDENGNPMKAC